MGTPIYLCPLNEEYTKFVQLSQLHVVLASIENQRLNTRKDLITIFNCPVSNSLLALNNRVKHKH